MLYVINAIGDCVVAGKLIMYEVQITYTTIKDGPSNQPLYGLEDVRTALNDPTDRSEVGENACNKLERTPLFMLYR